MKHPVWHLWMAPLTTKRSRWDEISTKCSAVNIHDIALQQTRVQEAHFCPGWGHQCIQQGHFFDLPFPCRKCPIILILCALFFFITIILICGKTNCNKKITYLPLQGKSMLTSIVDKKAIVPKNEKKISEKGHWWQNDENINFLAEN